MLSLVLLLAACTPKTEDSASATGDGYVPTAPPLVINEFLAVSEMAYEDPDGTDTAGPEFDNWVEIYNTGDAIVQYDGLYLTDDETMPTKWPLPAGQGIDAGGFDLFWADKDPEQGDHHMTFKLAGEGEFLGLYYVEDGYDPVQVNALQYGAQVSDLSQQRVPDGSRDWQAKAPTPLAPNQ